MKKHTGHIIFFLAALLMLAGCAQKFNDIKLTSLSLTSLTPRGFTAVDAVVEVGIDNPAPGFELFDMLAVVKLDGQPCLDLRADQLVVPAKTSRIYSVPVKGSLSDGFNPFSLLTLLQDIDLSRLTLDISAKVCIRGGVGKNIELKDLPLDKMVRDKGGLI